MIASNQIPPFIHELMEVYRPAFQTPPWGCTQIPPLHSPLTTSLWSLLAKSKVGRMDLNLLRISLCWVMSVARMHLQVGEEKNRRGYGGAWPRAERFRRTSSLDDSFPDAFVLICRQISEDVAPSLRNKEAVVVSAGTAKLIVDSKTTNCQ